MQDNFNIHNWQLKKAIEALDPVGKEDSDSSDDEQRKARKLAKKEKKKKAA